MEKNTKILLGVGGLAVLGYLLWQNSAKEENNTTAKVTFANASGKAGSPCTFKMDGEIVSGSVSELDTKYCFSTDGKRGLAI